MSEFNSLSEMFDNSPSKFLGELSPFRTKMNSVLLTVAAGETAENIETPTKCWQWRFTLYYASAGGPQLLSFDTFINGQPFVAWGVNQNNVQNMFKNEFPGVPYIQKNDKFSIKNNTDDSIYIHLEYDILVFENE